METNHARSSYCRVSQGRNRQPSVSTADEQAADSVALTQGLKTWQNVTNKSHSMNASLVLQTHRDTLKGFWRGLTAAELAWPAGVQERKDNMPTLKES